MSVNKRGFVRTVAFILAALMVFAVVVGVISQASAASQAQIDQLEDQKDELLLKKQELQLEIDQLESERKSYLALKEKLDTQIRLLDEEIELTNQQIEIYDHLIELKEQEIVDAQAEADLQYERLCARVRAMEEGGNLTYVQILFGATSFSDLLSRIDFMVEVMAYDNALEKQYIAARDKLIEIKAEYEIILEEQQVKKDELEEQQAEHERQVEEANRLIAMIEENLEEYKDAFEENEAAEKALQGQIDAMIAELKRQEEAARAAAAAKGAPYTGASDYATGTLIWPTPSSYKVSSQYGWRTHPIFGDQRYHAGIDISAGSGSTIKAADGGVVTTAVYSSSYGNYVVVNHGGGNTTLYAHMSSMAVKSGQVVSQGDTLGYVGSTGWSTGPHLHFEVTIGGSRVNPLDYYSYYTLA